MHAWLSRYSITNTSDRLRVAPAWSCLKVIFMDVGDILDSVWTVKVKHGYKHVKHRRGGTQMT